MFRRTMLLVLFLLISSAAFGDADTKASVNDFKRKFSSGMSAFTREAALDRLAELKDPAVRKAFQWAFDQTSTDLRRLVLDKDDATEELKSLEKALDDKLMRESERARRKGREPGQVSVPNTLIVQIQNARERVERLQKRIDIEHQIRKRLTQAAGTWLDGLAEDDRARVFKTLERKGLDDKDFTVRAFWIKSLGGAAHPSATRLLMGLCVTEKDRRILPVVIDALAEQAGARAIDVLLPLFADERWQIRATVIEALGRIGSPTGIQPLIDRLRLEEGRLRGDIAAALEVLTEQKFGVNPDRWQEWWDQNKAGFKPPRPAKEPDPEAEPAEPGSEPVEPPEPGGEPGNEPPEEDEPAPPPPPAGEDHPSFYGIDILSKRIIFVIDISFSMTEPAKAGDAERTKVDVAKYELKNAILALPDDAAFNIIFYHHDVSQWQKGMVTAKGKDRRAAVKFVENMIADGNTNIHDALKLAFHIVGMGAKDKNYEIGADTIFFLSDGQPNRGDIIDPVQILEEVKRWNQLRRVKIHTVGVGTGHAVAFMQALAASSGGTYVAR